MTDNSNEEENENNFSETPSKEITSSNKEISEHQSEKKLKSNINQIESVNNFEFLHQKELNEKKQ